VTPAEPLAELLQYLKAAGYDFVAVTPTTHARVLAKAAAGPPSLRDIFGWNRWFEAADVSPDLLAVLHAAEVLELRDAKLRARIRVARLGEDLLLHSAFPTDEADAVFFGPDTYRFVRYLEQQLPQTNKANWLVDMGAGSGAGAMAVRGVRPAGRTMMVDVNARALNLAAINAHAAGLDAEMLLSDTVPKGADLIIANPPYMMDAAARSYRDGGDLLGGAIALDWVVQALAALAPGGTVLLYTGAAFISGEAPLMTALKRVCAAAGSTLLLDEIDPDIFGEELEQPLYAKVERIAAVGATITKATGA